MVVNTSILHNESVFRNILIVGTLNEGLTSHVGLETGYLNKQCVESCTPARSLVRQENRAFRIALLRCFDGIKRKVLHPITDLFMELFDGPIVQGKAIL